MAIELGFTDESLKQCEYARCRNYRRRTVGFHYTPPEDGVDELAPYRREKTAEDKLLDALFQSKKGFKIQEKVHFRYLPRKLAVEWRKEIKEEDKISAWRELSAGKRQHLCQSCPVRPPDEEDCYSIHLSTYPGIATFKQGFIFTLLWLKGAAEQGVNSDIGSLKERVLELYRLCKGTQVRHVAEAISGLFESLQDDGVISSVEPRTPKTQIGEQGLEVLLRLLGESSVPSAESSMEKHDIKENAPAGKSAFVPFVDEFVSKFIYGKGEDTPYSVQEARLILPLLEALADVAYRATDFMSKLDYPDKKDEASQIVGFIEGFKKKLETLLKVLQIADKYDLEVEVGL